MPHCPKCSCAMSSVLESRPHTFKGDHVQVRLRVCRHCNHRYRTKESIDDEIKMPPNHRQKVEPIEVDPAEPVDPPEIDPEDVGKNPFEK